MDEDHNDNQSIIPSVVREETNATDIQNHGTLSETEDLDQQLITLLKKIKPDVLKPELQHESSDLYILGTQVSELGPFSNGEETSFERVREKAPYKRKILLSNDRNNSVKSGDNSASACSNPVNTGGDDAIGGEYYSSLSEEAPSEDGDCLSVMASNASNYHCQNVADKTRQIYYRF